MKKIKLNPLQLDKETIAKLDEQQLQEIVGGVNNEDAATSCSGVGSCDTVSSCSGGCSCSPADPQTSLV